MAKVKHIVLFQFKPGTSDAQIDGFLERMLDCSEGMEGLEDYVAGVNCRPQPASKQYSHGMVMTFRDGAALDTALAHADYQALLTGSAQILEDSVVLDFEL